jgi:hypothetical protein
VVSHLENVARQVLVQPGRPANARTRVVLSSGSTPVLVAAGVNLWIGVSRAGYSIADEAPVFLLVFGIPAAVALGALWALSRG